MSIRARPPIDAKLSHAGTKGKPAIAELTAPSGVGSSDWLEVVSGFSWLLLRCEMSMKRILKFGQLLGNPVSGTTTLNANPGAVLLRPESQFQCARLTGALRVPVLATGELLERSSQRNLQTNGREGGINCLLHLGEIRSWW